MEEGGGGERDGILAQCMTEAANSSRHSPSHTEIMLWDHLVECVSINLKKKKSVPMVPRPGRSRWERASVKYWTKTHWPTQGHFHSDFTKGPKMSPGIHKLGASSRLIRLPGLYLLAFGDKTDLLGLKRSPECLSNCGSENREKKSKKYKFPAKGGKW